MTTQHESNERHHLYNEIFELALMLPTSAVTKLTLLAIMHIDPSLKAQPISSTQVWIMLGRSVSKRSVERSLQLLEMIGVIHRTLTTNCNNVKIIQLNFKKIRSLTHQPNESRQSDGARQPDILRQPDGARQSDGARLPDNIPAIHHSNKVDYFSRFF